MLARKLEAVPPVSSADVLAVLGRRLTELRARRDEITKTIIALEGTTAVAGNKSLPAERAEALLNGEKFDANSAPPISKLAALHAERNAIDQALRIGQSRQLRLAAERATEIWRAHFDEIAALEKKRVSLALELQALNRERELLREKIVKRGGAGFLSTDSAELLGLGDRGDEVAWSLERLIADGIATRREIAK